jgi:hypothetical protein
VGIGKADIKVSQWVGYIAAGSKEAADCNGFLTGAQGISGMPTLLYSQSVAWVKPFATL